MKILEWIKIAVDWTNVNQGVISVAIFIVTVTFGWFSGILSTLRRKPKLKIETIPGPTFCCTYKTGREQQGSDTHKTAIAIYLHISNIGAAPSSIHKIRVGYHWDLMPCSMLWIKNSIGWFWIEHQAVALTDFQVSIGSNIKIYPFLTQKNNLSPAVNESFLEIGKSTNGVVYFEQPESWGGCYPKIKEQHVRLKIEITDVFGGRHSTKLRVPSVSLEEARKFNPEFGKTLFRINNQDPKENESNS